MNQVLYNALISLISNNQKILINIEPVLKGLEVTINLPKNPKKDKKIYLTQQLESWTHDIVYELGEVPSNWSLEIINKNKSLFLIVKYFFEADWIRENYYTHDLLTPEIINLLINAQSIPKCHSTDDINFSFEFYYNSFRELEIYYNNETLRLEDKIDTQISSCFEKMFIDWFGIHEDLHVYKYEESERIEYSYSIHEEYEINAK